MPHEFLHSMNFIQLILTSYLQVSSNIRQSYHNLSINTTQPFSLSEASRWCYFHFELQPISISIVVWRFLHLSMLHISGEWGFSGI